MKNKAGKNAQGKRKKTSISKRIALLVLAVVAASTILSTTRLIAGINSTNGVHINPVEIENSTLAIGSHLVHLSVLTDPIYTIAKKSVEGSGQENIYYKSELADGAWFNITTATSLKDITTGGAPVPNATISGLYFAYHTRANGITYDLLTGLPVNIFDLARTFNLRDMEELMPLDLQHKLLEETQSGSLQGKQKIDMLNVFWGVQVNNGATNEAGSSLAHLQAYYTYMSEKGAPTSKKNVVQNLMDAVDAKRRYEVMSIVEMELQQLAIKVSSYADPIAVSGSGSGSDSTPEAPAAVDAALQTAVNDCLANVTNAKASHAGKMMVQGVTLTAQLRYKWGIELIQSAAGQNFAACDTLVNNIIALDNIMGDVVQEALAEAEIMRAHLLGQAIARYSDALRLGVSTEYVDAKNAGNPEAVLRSIADDNANKVNGFRTELQFLIDAYCLRISGGTGSEYLAKLVQEAMGMYAVIPSGGFSEGSRISVNSYIEYLSAKQQEINAGDGAMNLMEDDLEKLKQQRLAALDRNDLEAALELEAKMKALQAELDLELKKLADELSAMNRRILELQAEISAAKGATKTALENELAVLQARVTAFAKTAPSSSLLSLLQRLKNECVIIINNTAASVCAAFRT